MEVEIRELAGSEQGSGRVHQVSQAAPWRRYFAPDSCNDNVQADQRATGPVKSLNYARERSIEGPPLDEPNGAHQPQRSPNPKFCYPFDFKWEDRR
jgi:hypothetical protein